MNIFLVLHSVQPNVVRPVHCWSTANTYSNVYPFKLHSKGAITVPRRPVCFCNGRPEEEGGGVWRGGGGGGGRFAFRGTINEATLGPRQALTASQPIRTYRTNEWKWRPFRRRFATEESPADSPPPPTPFSTPPWSRPHWLQSNQVLLQVHARVGQRIGVPKKCPAGDQLLENTRWRTPGGGPPVEDTRWRLENTGWRTPLQELENRCPPRAYRPEPLGKQVIITQSDDT